MCLSPSVADRALGLVFSKDLGLLQVVRESGMSRVRVVAYTVQHYFLVMCIPRHQMPTVEERSMTRKATYRFYGKKP
jgi:hypothetical protein